jgi:hypothetical protein
MSDYVMMDLGYSRTPTSARYRTEMPDGSFWDVPVQVIADSRDSNYADEKEDTVGFIKDGSLDKSEISDWASNNMNWDEVNKYAVRVDLPAVKVDFQEGWTNGSHKIVGKL